MIIDDKVLKMEASVGFSGEFCPMYCSSSKCARDLCINGRQRNGGDVRHAYALSMGMLARIEWEEISQTNAGKIKSVVGYRSRGLAACHLQKLAYERTSRGGFTVALLKVVDIKIDNLTYATLLGQMPCLPSQ